MKTSKIRLTIKAYNIHFIPFKKSINNQGTQNNIKHEDIHTQKYICWIKEIEDYLIALIAYNALAYS